MASTPQYASLPRSAAVDISVANTARDGTGTIVTLVTAGSNGTRIDDIRITARVTTTAGAIRMFLHDGTTARLIDEFLVTAVTPSNTVAVWSLALYNLGIVLQNGWSLRFSTQNSEAFTVALMRGGDL